MKNLFDRDFRYYFVSLSVKIGKTPNHPGLLCFALNNTRLSPFAPTQ
jgi:hypothetical protein